MIDPTLPALVESLTQNQAQLRSEVDRLRERSHSHGNKLVEHDAEIVELGRRLDDFSRTIDAKLDAIHASLKGDLSEIKDETKSTNGKVAEHSDTIAKLKGAFAILAIGAPSFVALAVLAIEHLH